MHDGLASPTGALGVRYEVVRVGDARGVPEVRGDDADTPQDLTDVELAGMHRSTVDTDESVGAPGAGVGEAVEVRVELVRVDHQRVDVQGHAGGDVPDELLVPVVGTVLLDNEVGQGGLELVDPELEFGEGQLHAGLVADDGNHGYTPLVGSTEWGSMEDTLLTVRNKIVNSYELIPNCQQNNQSDLQR